MNSSAFKLFTGKIIIWDDQDDKKKIKIWDFDSLKRAKNAKFKRLTNEQTSESPPSTVEKVQSELSEFLRISKSEL